MKRPVLIAVVVIIMVVGAFFFSRRTTPQDINQNGGTLLQYSNAKYGISFSYPAKYELNEVDAPGSVMREHHAITLINKADLPLPVDGEGPPAITIDIYQNNLDKQTTEQWIRNSSASNFKLGEGRLSTTTISGMPALSYRWSGLYEGTTIAIAQPKWVYTFTVTYLEMGADIIHDFVAIRDSVTIQK